LALKPPPPARMRIARFKRARVNIDYHVELNGRYYSVPHRLVRCEVWLRVSAGSVEIFAERQRVAVIALSAARWSAAPIPNKATARALRCCAWPARTCQKPRDPEIQSVAET